MKIFNITQANYLINNNCSVIGCALGNKCKVYIEFYEDESFKEHMKIWGNNTRNKKGDMN